METRTFKRGRPKLAEPVEAPRKFTRVYEGDDTINTWTYDLDITEKGPISVEIKYINGSDTQKYWNKRIKEAKEERRISREMRKINALADSKKKPKKKPIKKTYR